MEINVDKERKLNLISALSMCAGHKGIAGGQFLDLKFEKQQKNKKEIIDMQLKKTGELMGFCCESAAIVAGVEDDREKLKEVGLNLGLLFQISDDLLDRHGDSDKIGKPTKQDEIKGKATIMSAIGEHQTKKLAQDIQSLIKENLVSYGDSARTLVECANYIFKRDH